jgi:hypothetical protein
VLDLLTCSSELPASFENNGVVIENTDRVIQTVTKTATDFTCSVIGYVGHSYQLQTSTSLSGTWTPIGAPVTGTGASIQFTHTGGGTANHRFYRVAMTPL